MNYLALDIETIPNQLINPECMPVFDPEEVKHGNTKDPDKRAAKEAEEKEKFDRSISKTMSLDPAFCSICTFAACSMSDGKTNWSIKQMSAEDGHDDLAIVDLAIKTITAAYNTRQPIVTFNGLSFDLSVILFRAMAQDVHINVPMWQKITRKYANPHHYDLMQILSNWDRQRWHKQDFFVNLFGLGKNNFMDGSMVFNAYKAGEYDKIKDYCQWDVRNLSALFERVYPWIIVNEKDEGPKPADPEEVERLSKSFDEAQAE